MEAGWRAETVWKRRWSRQRGQLVAAVVVSDRSTLGGGDVRRRPEAWLVAAGAVACGGPGGGGARLGYIGGCE
uniref:Uncharacterized protein n=1 Tax=Oryza brachyantha TaxID=4533 RepID=J3LQN2_ORYBR